MILNIHTATEKAFVVLCNEEKIIDFASNDDPKLHSGFLHTAIDDLFKKTKINWNDIQAIGVTHGPGSYTGIRVGLAAAKGLCYARNLPLITFNTLELIAASITNELDIKEKSYMLCPMVDARRMEVFMCLYNEKKDEIIPPTAKIIDASFMTELDNEIPVYFAGSGIQKCQPLTDSSIFHFHPEIEITPQSICEVSLQKWTAKQFTDVVAVDALYLKEVYFFPKKS